MKFSEVKIPSNRKFGFFFTFLFLLAATYFFYAEKINFTFVFVALSMIFLLITLIKSDIFLPLNKLWMRFGLLLGMIISPIVLGLIFFCLFTPIAILMRISGRDELRLKLNRKVSHWIRRGEEIKSESFKWQF